MRNRVRGWLLIASASMLLTAGLVALPAAPATAHGTCTVNQSGVNVFSSKAHATISRSCANVHHNLWVTGIMQEKINGSWFCVGDGVSNCVGSTDNAYDTTFVQWNQTGAHDVACRSTQTTQWRVWRKDAGAFATVGSQPGHVIGSAFGPVQTIACRV